MNNKIPILYFFLLTAFAFIVLFLPSCQKETFSTNPDDALLISTDTITFDTVFTSVGSTTEFFTISNDANKSVSSKVSIGGGQSSQFRFNIDGVPATEINDLTIPADDSLYVFIQVTVDPNEALLPFILEDSLIFETNGNIQKVKLVAYGQNAVFLNGVEICDTTLRDELPYVIYNFAYIPEGCEVNIEEGVRIYSHRTSQFLVDGILNINGTKDSMVTFLGDRLEPGFRDSPAQWNGIEVLRGGEVNAKYANVQNGFYGFILGLRSTMDVESYLDYTIDEAPILRIENSIVGNCFLDGIVGFLSLITATNTIIHSCGQYNFLSNYGGGYYFTNCTFANYGTSSFAHREPIIAVGNAIEVPIDNEGNSVIATRLTDMYFGNCIIHGSEDEEVVVANQFDGGDPLNYIFENCLLKTERNVDTVGFVNCFKNPENSDTLFVDKREFDFRTHPLSPAIDAGSNSLTMPFEAPDADYCGNPRPNGGGTDIGAYEYYIE